MRAGKQREAIIQVTDLPPETTRLISTVEALSPPREKLPASRLYARLIGESGARCAD